MQAFHLHVDVFNARLLTECQYILTSNIDLRRIQISINEILGSSNYRKLLSTVFNSHQSSLQEIAIDIHVLDRSNSLLSYIEHCPFLHTLTLSIQSLAFVQSEAAFVFRSVINLTLDGHHSPTSRDAILQSIEIPNLTRLSLVSVGRGRGSVVASTPQ